MKKIRLSYSIFLVSFFCISLFGCSNDTTSIKSSDSQDIVSSSKINSSAFSSPSSELNVSIPSSNNLNSTSHEAENIVSNITDVETQEKNQSMSSDQYTQPIKPISPDPPKIPSQNPSAYTSEISSNNKLSEPTYLYIDHDKRLMPGESNQLVLHYDYDFTPTTITWVSYDENIVTVDQSGITTGISPGYVTVQATVDGKFVAKISIEVLEHYCTMVDDQILIEATCCSVGKKVIKCTGCGKISEVSYSLTVEELQNYNSHGGNIDPKTGTCLKCGIHNDSWVS